MIKNIGSSVPGLSETEIENKASKFRDLVFLSQAGPFPAMKIIEKVLPRIMPDFDFLVIDDAEMGNDHARTYPDQLSMHLSQSIYDGGWAKNGFSNFTLAHELGHLVLHRNIPSSYSLSKSSPKYDCYFNSEWQADRFADYLLMPTLDIKATCRTIEDVVERFDVLRSDAERRLKEVIAQNDRQQDSQHKKTTSRKLTEGQRQLAFDFPPKG